jgi:hypothetical protein
MCLPVLDFLPENITFIWLLEIEIMQIDGNWINPRGHYQSQITGSDPKKKSNQSVLPIFSCWWARILRLRSQRIMNYIRSGLKLFKIHSYILQSPRSRKEICNFKSGNPESDQSPEKIFRIHIFVFI